MADDDTDFLCTMPKESDTDDMVMRRVRGMYQLLDIRVTDPELTSMDDMVKIITNNLLKIIVPRIEENESDFYATEEEMEDGIPLYDDQRFVPIRAYVKAQVAVRKILRQSHRVDIGMAGCDGGSHINLYYLDDKERRQKWIDKHPDFEDGIVLAQEAIHTLEPGEKRKVDMQALFGGMCWPEWVYFAQELIDTTFANGKVVAGELEDCYYTRI